MNIKLPPVNFNKTQIENIISLAVAAGEIAAKSFQNRDFSVNAKLDGSKVTSTDIAVSKFLRDGLKIFFPQFPVICEEGDLREIASEYFFLIDPIDGTSSFAANNVEFCINIALVRNNKAIFGLIHAPLFEDGKIIFSDQQNRIISRKLNGEERILSRKKSAAEKLRIVTSSRSKDVDVANYMTQFHENLGQNFVTEKLASAIKFFRLLEGAADLYLHFRPSMEWDSAAGQALVELMGGKVKNLFFNQSKFVIGEDLLYKKPGFKNSPFIAFL